MLAVVKLIHRCRYVEAMNTFAALIEEFGAGGFSFRGWRTVLQAWLEAGEVRRARTVFNLVPAEMKPFLAKEEQILCDYEECLELGHSLYPADVPMAERWKAPRKLPKDVLRWYPGRVVSVEDGVVHVVVATPKVALEKIRVFLVPIKMEDWEAWANFPPVVDMFFELGFDDYAERNGLIVENSP